MGRAKGFFITGTDTGVGKTIAAAAIIRLLMGNGTKAFGMKPIETGCKASIYGDLLPEDGMILKEVAGMKEDIREIVPYPFRTPVAPLVASREEGKEINIEVIKERFDALLKKYDAGIVEGAGGLLVPVKKDFFMLDLAKELNLPILIVSPNRLGTLNHTLLTARYALDHGAEVAGIIMNTPNPGGAGVAEKTNAEVLKELSPVPVIGELPYIEDISNASLAAIAQKGIDSGALAGHI